MILTSKVNRDNLSQLRKSLKYSLYVITHPFDGFWDLTHENRGSLGAANILLFLLVLNRVIGLQYTNFMFMTVHWQYINMLIEIIAVIVPLLLWCVANWSLTTLMNGKGKLKEIYIGTAYAFTPSIIIGFTMTVISNVITLEEGVFFIYMLTFANIWSICLVLAAMMMIHDYSLGKAIFSSILTIVGIGIIVFILVLFFSLISDAAAYFVSLYKEFVFRIY